MIVKTARVPMKVHVWIMWVDMNVYVLSCMLEKGVIYLQVSCQVALNPLHINIPLTS